MNYRMKVTFLKGPKWYWLPEGSETKSASAARLNSCGDSESANDKLNPWGNKQQIHWRKKDLEYFLKESLVKGQKHFALFKMKQEQLRPISRIKGSTSIVSSHLEKTLLSTVR